MSEMVERVARAMYASEPCTKRDFSTDWRGVSVPVSWEEAGAAIQLKVTGYARAAIAAIREPTSEMVCAGGVEFDCFMCTDVANGDLTLAGPGVAELMHAAMIDEALR